MPASRRVLATLGACAVIALLTAAALGGPVWREWSLRRAPNPIDVVLITVDTTRADHLRCYGYTAGATPNLDALAAGGVIFERAYSHAPLTSPSHASLLTGLLPPHHGVRDNGLFTLDTRFPTLAEQFVRAGYRTGAFVSAFVLERRFGFARGFAAYEDDVTSGRYGNINDSITAGVTVDRALRWIANGDSRPMFVWVHLYDPHAPYVPPEPFRSRFKQRPYDGEIAYMDSELGRLLTAVRQRNRPTLVALVGDHGESLGEHKELGHAYFIYSATQRVPFILSFPGYLQSGVRVRPVVRGVDLVPTLLDIAQIPAPQTLDGQSLVPLIVGRTHDEPGSAYLESYQPRFSWGAHELVGLRSGSWLYIRSPRSELYNVDDDPGETKDLIKSRPSMASLFDSRLEKIAANGKGAPSPGMADPEVAGRLRALGYVSGTPVGSPADASLPDAKDNGPLLAGVTRGRDLKEAGQFSAALDEFQTVLAINPRSATVRTEIADVLMRLMRYDAALNAWKELYAERPDVEDYLVGMSAALAHLGRNAEALALFDSEIHRFANSARVYERRGRALIALGRWSDAEEALHEAVRLAPGLLAVRLELGAVLVRRKKLEQAVSQLQVVIEKSPSSIEGKQTSRLLVNIAGDLLEAGQFLSAAQAFRLAISGGERTEETYSNLALALYRLGRLDGTLEVLNEGAHVLPASASLQYRRGRVLQQLGRAPEAESAYRRALELDPKRGDAERALASLVEHAYPTNPRR